MSTPQNRITSANRYRVEIDGLPTIYATQADLPEKKAGLHEHQAGTQVLPEYGPSTVTISEFTFRHATGKNNVDRSLMIWFNSFNIDGLPDKRSARVVQYDHTGRVPLRTYELFNCCPSSYKPEQLAGKSNDTAEFSFSLQPEDFDII
jgi:hypothetical protein